MSAMPAAPVYPEPTPADHEAMFASVVWFREQEWAGLVEKYQGMYVAISGHEILDADRDKEQLVRRLDERVPLTPNRVVLQYVHRPEDWNWK